jgi:formylglycine-generating enzyme required for sulfatase activity
MKNMQAGFILIAGLLCAPVLSWAESPATSALDVGLKNMVLIPGGPFTSGAPIKLGYQLCKRFHNGSCSRSWFEDEEPIRTLTLDPFYIDKYEVTQREFERIMRRIPSEFKGKILPVDSVNWKEARSYCHKIGKRLPTEAEWEKASQGGVSFVYPWGDKFESGKANFCDRRCSERWRENKFQDGHEHTAPVGSYPPNGYGLYDMAGNVYEWVEDWYDKDYYRVRTLKNPKGPLIGSKKVVRGGSWINYSVGVRPADRTDADPDNRFAYIGFRCAR